MKRADNLQEQLKVLNTYMFQLNELELCITFKPIQKLVKELRAYLKKLDRNKYEAVIEHLYYNIDVDTKALGIDFGTDDSSRFVRSKQEVHFVLKNIIKDIDTEIGTNNIVSLFKR